jgi:hypothetical protein
MNVYECIAAVSAELAKTGIAKDRKNEQQHYKFRGIDEVFNALAPLLSKHGLVILPRILTRECVERTSKSGSSLFFITVEAEFDFVSAKDGSRHTVRTFGEAQDSGDKATNKAMSAAYKYAAFQAFCIPTEGDNDADATTAEATVPKQSYEDWLDDLTAASDAGYDALMKAVVASRPDYKNRLRSDKVRWKALETKAQSAKVAVPA